MGKIIPSALTKENTFTTNVDKQLKNIANTYLTKDCSRTEQVNTANAVIASHLELVCRPKPDLCSFDSCAEAITFYFQTVSEKCVRPTISGIALAFGLSRTEFLNACESGMVSSRYMPSAIALPNEVWGFFCNLRDNYVAMLEGFLETNVIHPSAGSFLLKNNSDYKDVVERRVSVTQAVVDVNALAEKYKQELDSL